MYVNANCQEWVKKKKAVVQEEGCNQIHVKLKLDYKLLNVCTQVQQ